MNSFPSHWQIQTAARWIRSGGVIAYPTEAVFGLGCDPGNREAVQRLLDLKRRPMNKGLILVASRWQQLQPWLQPVADAQLGRMNKTWPGPTTWLVPAADDCPAWLTGQHTSLAVRVSAHPLVRQLCGILDSAIVSTSANISKLPPARSVLDIRLRFGRQLDFVLPGSLGGRTRPSRILDLVSGQLLRS